MRFEKASDFGVRMYAKPNGEIDVFLGTLTCEGRESYNELCNLFEKNPYVKMRIEDLENKIKELEKKKLK